MTLSTGIGGAATPVPTQTDNVNGTAAVLTRTANLQVVAATVGGLALELPWRSPGAGISNLRVAKFRLAEFIVIADSDPGTGSGPGTLARWTFLVFDLRSGATAQPVKIGPFELPATETLNICPSDSGQLLLLWHALALLPSRRAWVQRSEVPESTVPLRLATGDDLGAAGTLGAQVDAAGRTLTVFDNASRNGNVSVARTAASTNRFSAALPAPGRLALKHAGLDAVCQRNGRSLRVAQRGRRLSLVRRLHSQRPLQCRLACWPAGSASRRGRTCRPTPGGSRRWRPTWRSR